jgi:hypothetical protein
VNERNQLCPICSAEVMPMSRYPDYVCDLCEERVVDSLGRKVTFFNQSISGGLVAMRQNLETGKFDIEDPELAENPIVFIDGIQCFAADAHFGGVVIRKAAK